MTRRELVLKKLHELAEEEVEEAIKNLTKHIKARLRFGSYIDRTKTGAHGKQSLGMNAIDFYVGESIKRLFDPNGWDWKFEKLTLSQQLTRIANKLISDQVEKYVREKELKTIPIDKDAGELYDLEDDQTDNDWYEKASERLITLALEISQDDDKLFYFATLYFDNYKYEDISKELNISIEDVYVLHRKLVRRLINHKDKIIE